MRWLESASCVRPKSAAALDHPYICHIHEAGESDGQGFIAMEYVDGETLKDRLGQGPVPLEEALRTASEMAEALGGWTNT